MISGVIWGIAGVFPVSPNDFIEQMFLTFVLAGLAAGAMSTLSSFRGAYAAFLVPAILPFAIKIMLQEGEVFVAMSVDADPVHRDDVADFGTPLPIGDRIAPAALRQRASS